MLEQIFIIKRCQMTVSDIYHLKQKIKQKLQSEKIAVIKTDTFKRQETINLIIFIQPTYEEILNELDTIISNTDDFILINCVDTGDCDKFIKSYKITTEIYELINNMAGVGKCEWINYLLALANDDIQDYYDYIRKYGKLEEQWKKYAKEEKFYARHSLLKDKCYSINDSSELCLKNSTEYTDSVIYVWLRVLRIISDRHYVITNGQVATMVATGFVYGNTVTFESISHMEERMNTSVQEREFGRTLISNLISYKMMETKNIHFKTLEINLGQSWLAKIIMHSIKDKQDYEQLEKEVIQIKRFYKMDGEILYNLRVASQLLKLTTKHEAQIVMSTNEKTIKIQDISSKLGREIIICWVVMSLKT